MANLKNERRFEVIHVDVERRVVVFAEIEVFRGELLSVRLTRCILDNDVLLVVGA